MPNDEEDLKQRIRDLIFVSIGVDSPYLAGELVDIIRQQTARAELEAQMGMLEYYDQVPDNESMDWKALFAENRSVLEQQLKDLDLDLPNKREE